MYRPTARVLTLLELLQSRSTMTGADLAQRLEVNIRTVRRYVEILQDLGIPVVAERGRHGAYRLRPGFKMPPLVFSDDEALALTLGLLAVRRLGLIIAAPAVEGALAKVNRVLPATLAERVQAVQEVLVLHVGRPNASPPGATLFAFSTAVEQHRQVRIHYVSGRGEETERIVDPYGVVYHAGVWYTAGYCHLRQEPRTFRLDRVLSADVLDKEESFTPPGNFDCLETVMRSIISLPRTWKLIVTLHTTLADAQLRIPPSLATLEETELGVIMRCTIDDPAWMAGILVGLGCDLEVHEPPEVRDALRHLAERVLKMADTPRLLAQPPM